MFILEFKRMRFLMGIFTRRVVLEDFMRLCC